MGFLSSIYNKMVEASGELIQRKYGIRHPYDSIDVVSNLIFGPRDRDEKVSCVREIMSWLRVEADRGNKYAEEARQSIKKMHQRFLVSNNIKL